MSSRREKKGGHKLPGPLFKELAVKNVKRSARDYSIYFLTLTLGVCLFYTFNSIGTQFSMLEIEDTLNFLPFTTGVMALTSLFICAVMGFLVVYANRFLLKRRKKEMGIYLTLGMERGAVAELLMRETWIIGVFSLLAGLAAGILASQGLALVTARIVGIRFQKFHILISPLAIAESVLFFGIIFWIVHRFNVKEIRRLELIDLLYANRKNEAARGGWFRNIFFFLVSILTMVFGHAWLFFTVDRSPGTSLTGGVLLIGAGVWLFFSSVSGPLVKLLSRRKKFYFRGLNMFVLRQLGSRIQSAGRSMAVICILLFLSVSAMAVGLGLGKAVIQGAEESVPYDVTMTLYAVLEGGGIEAADYDKGQETSGGVAGNSSDFSISKMLRDQGMDVSRYFSDFSEFIVYEEENVRQSGFLLPGYQQGRGKDGQLWPDEPARVIGVKDYNRAMELQGGQTVKLSGDEFAINFDTEGVEGALRYYAGHIAAPVTVNGVPLKPAGNAVYKGTWQTRNRRSDAGTLIVPQEVTAGMRPVQWVLNGSFRGGDEGYDAFLQAALESAGSVRWYAKQDIMVEVTTGNITMSYLGIYLGISFLITAGAVLALQQLSQSADNEERYVLLKKLGTKKSVMKKSVLSQLLLYFGLPLGLALLNAAAVIAVIYVKLPELKLSAKLMNLSFALGIVFVLYALYFFTTYGRSKRILRVR